jgi:DNA-binding transcriptional LysR family regulator
LSGAARALGVNHATVARRISALEAALGKVLFDRRADGYGLTPNGQAALDIALAVERSVIAFAESVGSDQFEGSVRVTTIRSFANAVLASGLTAMVRRFPGLVLEILTDIRVMSLARREADIAVRLGRPKDSGLVGRKLAQVHYAFYGARGDANREEPHFIANDQDAAGVIEAAWLEKQLDAGRIFFRSNSFDLQAAAARAGLGVVMLPCYLGDRDPGLKRVYPMAPHPPRDLWILSPRELSKTPRVRLVLDEIEGIVAAHRDLIEGRA